MRLVVHLCPCLSDTEIPWLPHWLTTASAAGGAFRAARAVTTLLVPTACNLSPAADRIKKGEQKGFIAFPARWSPAPAVDDEVTDPCYALGHFPYDSRWDVVLSLGAHG